MMANSLARSLVVHGFPCRLLALALALSIVQWAR